MKIKIFKILYNIILLKKIINITIFNILIYKLKIIFSKKKIY